MFHMYVAFGSTISLPLVLRLIMHISVEVDALVPLAFRFVGDSTPTFVTLFPITQGKECQNNVFRLEFAKDFKDP